MKPLAFLLDRTAVLFLGVAAGAAIGYAFVGDRAPSKAPPPPPIATPAAAAAPPQKVAEATTPECAMPFTPHLLATVQSGEKVRIGVFGDSFGDGVWSGLYRLLPRSDNFEVVKYSRQSTGFTRYGSLNLEEHDSGQIAADPVDIAVISFGANDTQGIVIPGGKYAALMSPEWQAEIGRRIDSYVRMLRGHGAMVYWVGLPRMRKESFDADIQAMNGFYAARMRALGVPFIDTRPFASDPEGQYAAYLPNPETGKKTLMRANDGIHMSMTGYMWITKGLAGRIRTYVDAARDMAGPPPASAPAQASMVPGEGGSAL